MTNTNIVYLTNANTFEYSENSTIIKIEDMLQRMQTFLSEQSMNGTNGIDYIGVFNKRSFINPQLDKIIADYTKYFQSIVYVLQPVTTAGSLSINLRITLFNGDVALRSFIV